MNIKINECDGTITVSETLSFEEDVSPIYDDVVQTAKEELYSGAELSSLDDVSQIQIFINHRLTDIDKVEIMGYVREEFEYSLDHYSADEASLFDQVMLKAAVTNWAKDKFDITYITGE